MDDDVARRRLRGAGKKTFTSLSRRAIEGAAGRVAGKPAGQAPDGDQALRLIVWNAASARARAAAGSTMGAG